MHPHGNLLAQADVMTKYPAMSALVGSLDILLPVPFRLLKSLLVLRIQQLQELLALLGRELPDVEDIDADLAFDCPLITALQGRGAAVVSSSGDRVGAAESETASLAMAPTPPGPFAATRAAAADQGGV